MRKGPRLRTYLIVLFFSLLAFSGHAPAQQPVAREYQIKAVFLFNFTQFVQWPTHAFKDPSAPLVIGVLGEDPFGSILNQTITGEAINNHNLVVERYGSVDQVKDCHILFISLTDKQDLRRALDKVKARPILTVSDTEGFTRMGGMIRFYNEVGRTRLRINMEPVNESELIISSKLLRLAEIVPGTNN